MRLLIIGATGGTGLQVTSQAVEGGHRVTAIRPVSAETRLTASARDGP